MLMHNNGALAAALIIAGVSLPESFNVDDGAVERKAAEFGIQHPNLDKQAHLLLAEVEVSKDFRDAYFPVQEETHAEEIADAADNHGQDAAVESPVAEAPVEPLAAEVTGDVAELPPPPPADPEGHEAGDIPAGVFVEEPAQ